MKALFLGNVAADTANGIRAELPPELDVEIVADPKELTSKAAAETEILVTNIWRADYPPAPRIAFVQSVATGIEWIEQPALPTGVPICNAYGHETAIAEYVLMVMLVWSHRFREIESGFRERSSWAPSWVESGAPHGEIRGSTLGVWSQALMVHYFLQHGGRHCGPGSSRQRHDDSGDPSSDTE